MYGLKVDDAAEATFFDVSIFIIILLLLLDVVVVRETCGEERKLVCFILLTFMDTSIVV